MNPRPDDTQTAGSNGTVVPEKTAGENSADLTRSNNVADLQNQPVILCLNGYVDVYLTDVHGVSEHVRIRSIT